MMKFVKREFKKAGVKASKERIMACICDESGKEWKLKRRHNKSSDCAKSRKQKRSN
jgi:hypothetical protein